jgi:3-oxoacyl-[acyl-carrier-protein] synthase II
VLGDDTLGLLSGASGAQPATGMEQEFIQRLAAGRTIHVRGFGTMLGHALEAQMPAGVALAAAAMRERAYFPPFGKSAFETSAEEAPQTIAVSVWGHWRGEAVAVIRPAQ